MKNYVFCIAFLLLTASGFSLSENEFLATVVEKSYIPSDTGLGTALTTTSTGKLGTGIISTHSSEQYVLIVSYERDGKLKGDSLSVSPEAYISVSVGDQCVITSGFWGNTFERKWTGKDEQQVEEKADTEVRKNDPFDLASLDALILKVTLICMFASLFLILALRSSKGIPTFIASIILLILFILYKTFF